MTAAPSGNAHAARVTVIVGATGCGKTHELKKRLARPKRRRTIIWSPKEPIDRFADFYPGSVVVRTASDALAVVKAAGAGAFHLVFHPRLHRPSDEAHFGILAKIAMAARNVTVIVDEAHTVTRPSWAPDGWSELVMMGRGYGCEVFALSQRPASMDKDTIGNASCLRVGRLGFPADMKAVAQALNVRWQDVAQLTGYQWIQRDMLTGQVTRG